MDESGHIKDPRRLLNRDECPQFIDYACEKGNARLKVAAGASDPAYKTGSENRTSVSVDMAIGLGGFQYGFH